MLSQKTLPTQHLNFLSRIKLLINRNLTKGTRDTLYLFNSVIMKIELRHLSQRKSKMSRRATICTSSLYDTLSPTILWLRGKECKCNIGSFMNHSFPLYAIG